MNDPFRQVVRQFQSRVAAAVSVFREHGVLDMLGTWHSRQLPQVGYIDSERRYRYAFHGIGCAVTFPSGERIDWDFGHDQRMDGFDEWRIKTFVSQRPEIAALLAEDQVAPAFKEARDRGEIVSPWRDQSDSLYYFREDVTQNA